MNPWCEKFQIEIRRNFDVKKWTENENAFNILPIPLLFSKELIHIIIINFRQ